MNSENNTPIASGPLVGLKVIDFTSVIAGSYAAASLGDLGADVIKFESLLGDLARYWGPFYAGEGRGFQAWNRSKRGIAVDLRTDAGLEIAYAMIREADIVMENYRNGVTERLKVDYESIRKINPSIIYCSVSGFGTKGPMSELPAFDTLLQSMGGSARMQAQNGNCGKSACAVPHVAFADIGASFLGVTGILSALYHREKTGEGQKLETSLLQGAMALQPHYFFEALDVEPEAVGGLCPYSFFDTKDDVIFIAAVTNNFFRLLCEGLGEPGLANESKYKTNTDRMEHKDKLVEKLNSILRTRTTDDWVDILVDKGVPCAPALTHQEFWDHPQVNAMNMKVAAHHSTIGAVHMGGIPVNFDKTPGGVRYASPCLGEHTDELLREIGYDDARIESLREEGVVK